MENAKPFALLKTPEKALKEILSMSMPFDIVRLSRTSRKTFTIISKFKGVKPLCHYRVVTKIERPILITIIGDHLEETIEIVTGISDLQKYVEYLISVFGWTLMMVFFSFDPFKPHNKMIAHWLKHNIENETYVSLHSAHNADEDVLYFLKVMIHKMWHLELNTQLSDDFKMVLPATVTSFNVPKSKFITFKILARCDCKTIRLRQTKVTSQELNQFFKNWMTSKSHRSLQHFEIYIENREALDVILDLPGIQKMAPGVSKTLERDKKPFEVTEGFEVKKNSRVTATIFTENKEDDLVLVMLVN